MNKRKGVVIALVGLVLFSLVWGSLSRGVTLGGLRAENKIVLIRLSGSIAESGDLGLLGTAGITPHLVQSHLRKASQDPRVKAVVLRIDSPGGAAAASQEIATMIKDFSKPVVVSMGDIAASGGFYISVYADKIVANPGTTTGSIGVITNLFYIQGLLEKLGIAAEIIKSGEHKDMFLRPLTAEERAILQDFSDEVYEQFVQAVAEGRNLPLSQVQSLATGQVYTGSQAKELGLIDELGDLKRAEQLAAELVGIERPVIEEYGPAPFWQWLLGLSSDLKRSLLGQLPNQEIMLWRMIEGWQGVPRYQ